MSKLESKVKPMIVHMDLHPGHKTHDNLYTVCKLKRWINPMMITTNPEMVTCKNCLRNMNRLKKKLKPGCECKDWQENISKVNGPITLQAVRTGGRGYTGTQFVYCPWCAKKLPKTK